MTASRRTMKALYYSDWQHVEVADVPLPKPAVGEVLIRIEACGICGSEIECVEHRHPRRKPPLILGHEFSGAIEELGSGVAGFSIGQPVVANSVIPCGKCLPCQRGEMNLCRDRKLFGMHRPGGCAEFVAAPASVVYSRPEGMSPVMGALVEPASNGVHAMSLLPHQSKSTVFIFGAGIIGLMTLQAAKALHGSKVAVADILPDRLECARALGADRVLNPAEMDVVKAAMDFSGQDGIDYVVDAVGAEVTKRQSLDIARPGGAVCWLGLRDDSLTFSSFGVTNPQKIITGSYAATVAEFMTTIRLAHEGKIAAGPVTTCSLADAADFFRKVSNPAEKIAKLVVLP